MHILYCWSDRPILCGNVIEFDGKKCLYSRSFRFYKHFDVSEKNMGCLAQKNKTKKKKKKKNKKNKKTNMFATFPLLANADKIYKNKVE